MEDKIKKADPAISALFLEVIQGNGGIVVPPTRWFERLKEIVAQSNILLVLDEVQTGLGRTGRMFASEHFGLEPDIITMAKAIGGALPMGVTLVSAPIAEKSNTPRASTFGGICIVAKAGSAVIDTILEEGLVSQSQDLGEDFKSKLMELQQQYACIGDVRGL